MQPLHTRLLIFDSMNIRSLNLSKVVYIQRKEGMQFMENFDKIQFQDLNFIFVKLLLKFLTHIFDDWHQFVIHFFTNRIIHS